MEVKTSGGNVWRVFLLLQICAIEKPISQAKGVFKQAEVELRDCLEQARLLSSSLAVSVSA